LQSVRSAMLPSRVLHINHYFTKSDEDWQAKSTRGRLDRKPTYSRIFQPLYNDHVDLGILLGAVDLASNMTGSRPISTNTERLCATRRLGQHLVPNGSSFPRWADERLKGHCSAAIGTARTVCSHLLKGENAAASNWSFAAERFALVHTQGRCCHPEDGKPSSTFMLMRSHNNFVREPQGCERLCATDPACAFFSHSVHWQNCILCSACVHSNATRNRTGTKSARRYTSWERLSHVVY
jgi:hypothetical protein